VMAGALVPGTALIVGRRNRRDSLLLNEPTFRLAAIKRACSQWETLEIHKREIAARMGRGRRFGTKQSCLASFAFV
jgi:hypothetical protein